jgi:hypothetical protein
MFTNTSSVEDGSRFIGLKYCRVTGRRWRHHFHVCIVYVHMYAYTKIELNGWISIIPACLSCSDRVTGKP